MPDNPALQVATEVMIGTFLVLPSLDIPAVSHEVVDWHELAV
jgi:hypothetical protein